MQGKKVLELGAGTGLVTTVASLLGEWSSLNFQIKSNRFSFNITTKTF